MTDVSTRLGEGDEGKVIVGSGTLTWLTSFHADFDCATFEPSNFAGRGSITGGSGALASLRGPLTFGIDTYEGVLR